MNLIRWFYRLLALLFMMPAALAGAQTVKVSPTGYVTAALGGTVQFTATVTGTTNTAVTWSASGGSIDQTGLFTAPTTVPANAIQVKATLQSSRSISGSQYVYVLNAGPQITEVSPNPLPVGTYTVTISGSGFQSGAVVENLSNGSTIQLTTGTVTSNSITASGYQAPAQNASFTVINPGSSPSNAIVVPVVSNSGTKYTLAVNNGTNSGSYSAGTTVSISANAAPTGQTFVKWTGATVANATSPNTTLVMPAQNTSVTATYSGPQQYALSVVNGTGSGSYPAGQVVTITANAPPANSVFTNWTGATVANSTASTTTIAMPSTSTTVTANYAVNATIPFPVTTHPRLWVTVNDIPKLRGWATTSNSVYAQGMAPLLQKAISAYQNDFFPNGQPNANYPDPGDTQGYQGELTEQYAAILAFNSLIDPSSANRIKYAQYARNMLMYAMNQAALGVQANAPFRDPMFPVYNRANGSGEQWPLIVDWIYNAVDQNNQPILTPSDKQTIRNVFMIWANECLNASTTGGDHPTPIGTTNSLNLLPSNQPYRMASNNYYLGHARLLTMMSLCMDPNDDPLVNTSLPAATLGNTLRSYILDANGAWLYQEYAMMGEAANVASQYSVPNNAKGTGFGLASGGLPPEGMLYGHSFSFVLGQLLALQTAGFNNVNFTGPQANLISAPVWSRFVQGFLSSMTPTSQTPPSEPWLGPVYEFGSYGDVLRMYLTPDFMQPFALLALLEQESGQSTTHADIARWVTQDVVEGPFMYNINTPFTWSSSQSILAYLLFDPSAATPTDPRPTYPTTFFDPAAGRVVAHSDWSATGTFFNFRSSWESINHQNGDSGQFELYRNGEWLTKGMSNYDNNGVGFTPYYHNGLCLKNWCPNGTPTISWFENGEWTLGGNWILGDNAGDPTTVSSNGQGYVYASSDMTNLYNRPDVWDANNALMDIKQATRQILWLNNDYVVIYDRATSIHPGLFKTFNLDLVTAPTINGNVATETLPSGQQLFMQTLLPLSPTIASANTAGNLNPIAELEPTRFTMTVQDPTLPTDTRFLHVLQGANSGVSMVPATYTVSASGEAFDGAVFGASAVFFPTSTGVAFTTTTFNVPSTVTNFIVTGLTPGASYKVSVVTNGNVKTVSVSTGTGATADSAGLVKAGI